jgi:dynein heavy chain
MVEEPEKIALLEEIAEAATQEFGIERMKNKMTEEWFSVSLDIKDHKDTGTYIISGASVDEIQALLDDHLIKTVNMKSSQHARIFEQSLTEWEGWLKYCYQLFECWIKVQGMWLYLEPVFSSADIIKHLPVEQSEF